MVSLVAVYVLTAPGTRSEAEDAFSYAYDLEHKSLRDLMSGTHVSHLLFLPLARGLLHLARFVVADLRAYDLVRVVNCLLVAAAIIWLHRVLRRRLELSNFAATAGTVGVAVSYGCWRYANETEVYALTMLIIVAFCGLALSQLDSAAKVVTCAAVGAAATLLYTLAAVAALIVAPLVLLCGRRFRDLALYFLTFVLLAGGVNYGAYRFVAPAEQNFAQYVLASGPGAGSTLTYSPNAILTSTTGLGHDVVTTNFLFAYPKAAQWLQARFPLLHLEEERYTAERAGRLVAILPVVTIPALLLLTTVILWRAVRRGRAGYRSGRIDVRLVAVLAWMVAYALVLAGTSGAAPEPWIPLLPAVWIILSAAVFERTRDRSSRLLVAALLAVLFVHNSVGGYWMIHSRSADFNAAKATPILARADENDMVLTADGSTFVRYLRYQSTAQIVDFTTLNVAELQGLEATIQNHSGQIFATAGVFDPPSQLRLGAPDLFHAAEKFSTTMRPFFCEVVDTEFGGVHVYRGCVTDQPGCSCKSRSDG